MSRQLGAALLALVVAGGQASLVVCQVACAASDHAASADGAASTAHTCYRTQPSDGPLIDAGVHVCGHDEELPAAAQAASAFAPADAAVALPVVLASESATTRARAARVSPPGLPRLPIPLRI